MTWLVHLLIRPHKGRFSRVDRDCRWYGSHRDVRWTRHKNGRVLVGQCQSCRVVVGCVVQRVPDDGWEGCVD